MASLNGVFVTQERYGNQKSGGVPVSRRKSIKPEK